MSITRENYESFFLDYLEGSLDSSLREEMDAFLKRNPDLKAELKEFEQVSLPADSVRFEEKEQLKKTASTRDDLGEPHFDHLCIAKIEGDLNIHEEKALDQMLIGQPQRKKELDLYFKTKLQPLPVIFPDKQLLKRKAPVFRLRSWYSVSAAASVILILVFSLLLSRFRNPQEERIAIIQPTAESSDNKVSEATAIMEEDIPSIPEEFAERMVTQKQPEDQEKIDVVAMNIPETPMQKEGENFSGNGQETPADRRANLERLHRREFALINTSPEVTLATAGVTGRDNEGEGEYLTLREVVAGRLRSTVSAKEPGETGREDRITFLDIADAGVRGINRITGVDMKLERYYDQSGELTSYAFTSKPLSFSHEVKKKTSL